jgi:3D-(3,5/4)-trihydroxycyclohexane-1,2-dione acylhydrolase (decyclizing)
MGCATWEAASAAELTAALDEAREQPRPAVIACQIDPYRPLPASGAWWDLGVPEVAEDPAVAAAAAEQAAGASGRRFYG